MPEYLIFATLHKSTIHTSSICVGRLSTHIHHQQCTIDMQKNSNIGNHKINLTHFFESPKYLLCVVSNHSMDSKRNQYLKSLWYIQILLLRLYHRPTKYSWFLSYFSTVIIIAHLLRLTHSRWIFESEAPCILRYLDRVGHICSAHSDLCSLFLYRSKSTIRQMMHWVRPDRKSTRLNSSHRT